MNFRQITTLCLCILCGALVWAAWSRQHKLDELRLNQAQYQELAAQAERDAHAARDRRGAGAADVAVPLELLQLRNQVARLSAEKRELAGAATESQQLRRELDSRPKPAPGSGPAGMTNYLRLSQAKWMGYHTPEDTLQSLMWATSNHDAEKLLEAIVPETAKYLREKIEREGREEFFKSEQMPPGYAVVGKEPPRSHGPDEPEEIVLHVQITPEIPPSSFSFRNINGQWKLTDTP